MGLFKPGVVRGCCCSLAPFALRSPISQSISSLNTKTKAMAEVTETPAAAEVPETPVEAAKEEAPAEETPAVNGEAEAEPAAENGDANGHANGNGHAEEANGHAEENGKEEEAPAAEEKAPEADAEPPVKKVKKAPKVPSNANRRSSSRLTNATTGTKLSAEITSDNLPKGAC